MKNSFSALSDSTSFLANSDAQSFGNVAKPKGSVSFTTQADIVTFDVQDGFLSRRASGPYCENEVNYPGMDEPQISS